MRARLVDALLWAALALLLAGPIMGLQLVQVGARLSLEGEWAPVLWVVLAVFLFRLGQPLLRRTAAGLPLPRAHRYIHDLVAHPWVLAAVLMGLVVWPFFGSRGAVDLATLAMIYIMLGLGLNIVVGFAGLLDLGYVAFYAVGAYAYGLLNQYYGLSFWQSLPAGVALAALFGFVLGFPVLRLRGDYLAIVTLGFGEIIRLILNNWDDLTGGPNGVGGIPKPTLFGLEFSRRPDEGNVAFHEFFGIPYDSEQKVVFLYLLALLLVVATVFVIHRLSRMPIGRAWEALREDEIACRSLGLSPTAVKLSAFTLGASFAGFAGCFFAARQGFISPESFTFIESAIILAIVILGGMGSQAGVILAALAMVILPEVAREFEEYRMLIFGFAMVLMMIWRPQGLLPARRARLTLPESTETESTRERTA